MTSNVSVGRGFVTWQADDGVDGGTGSSRLPGAWEITIDNDAGTYSLSDCILMRGPVTGNLGQVNGALSAAYVGIKIDVETHAVTTATYATVSAATDSAVPEDPSYVKAVLYRLAQNGSGKWYVVADFRNQLSLVMYV